MTRRERRFAAASLLMVLFAWGLVALVTQRSTPDLSPATIPTLAILPTASPTDQTAAFASAPESQVAPPESAPVSEAQRIIVRFEPDSTAAERADYLDSLGATTLHTIDTLNSVVVSVPDTMTDMPPAAIVTATEPDYEVTALIDVPTSDPYFAEQWALPVIGAPEVWAELPDDVITVAVIDSGICADHPDLAGRILPGYDYVEQDTIPQDEFGHGCAVAGVIASNADNAIGIAGVAPNVAVQPLKVLNESGVGSYSNVAAAIIQATDDGAAIINLSLGGPFSSQTLANAVDYALDHDVLVIAAAGNTGDTQVLYPAAYDAVIAVGAVNADLQRSAFSSYGPQIDIQAPGETILTLALGDGYATMSGTSLAAPHVAGAAALEIARGNTLILDGGILSVGMTAQPQPTPPIVSVPPAYSDLLAKANQNGMIRVIVGLNVAYQPESQLSSAQAQTQRISVAQAQQSLISSLTTTNTEVVSESDQWSIPALAVSVDAAGLAQLANDPAVTRITEDRLLRPALAESVPYMGTHNAWSLNIDGTGMAIAIVDSGVDSQHEFLDDGKVIHEACFSSNYEPYGATSLCPSGSRTSLGSNDPGSAMPTLCLNIQGCYHGTHVAGIAAGKDGSNPGAPNGVAPGVSIVAIQIFSRFPPSECDDPDPCLLAFLGDQISALDHLTRIVDDLDAINIDLAAVNMSLGSYDRYTEACDDIDPDSAAFIAELKTLGVATIASAGNEAYIEDPPGVFTYEDGISDPSCLSDVISVGSSSAPDDVISTWSQSAPILDVYAPGESILSSFPGNNSYAEATGTSMAAAHMTGAWALVKQANPTATVNELLAIMQSTGVPLLDTRPPTNRTRSRIQVDAAVYASLSTELVVNTTVDTNDDGVCDLTLCSLREAITQANITTGITEHITFDIGGGGQQTIVLDNALGPLPPIIDPVLIDGATQPGYSGTPLIEIDGTNVAHPTPEFNLGLNIIAGNSLVRGLVINNFSYGGIGLTFEDDNLIVGNYIGTEPDGTTAAPNLYGIIICSSDSNQIGGVSAADHNLISGNNDDGINICQLPGGTEPVADGNIIQGNTIGLDITGDVMLGNGDDGIKIEDATNTLIGGTANGAGNVISGQNNGSRAGINIIGPVATGTIIQGNLIGPNADGDQAFSGNTSNLYGINIWNSPDNLIGGTIIGSANLISGNLWSIQITGNNATGNIIQQNFIGTDYTGVAALPDQTQHGIYLGDGTPTGAVTDTLIGGTDPAAFNVIVDSVSAGIAINGSQNTIQGNFIGTDPFGAPIPNHGFAGIYIEGTNNLIGGTTVNSDNLIANNDGSGIIINADSGSGNAILGNQIYDNLPGSVGDGLGIDLGEDDVTANDEDDLDTGPNNLQNFPVLTDVTATVNTAVINGTLNSTPNETFRIELFTNDACDPSGYGEGQSLLTAIENVNTNGDGDATFNYETFDHFDIGTGFTATATDSSNNTSEFSACLELNTVDNSQMVVNTTYGGPSDGNCDSHCSLKDAIAEANSLAGVQTIRFDIPGPGPHIIQPTSDLQNLTNIIIDGTTQPGYTPGGPRLIVLDGSAMGSRDIMTLHANNVIRGLALYNSVQSAIKIQIGPNVIEGNFIGTDPTGTFAMGNGVHGIVVDGAMNVTIGGTTPEARNIISGNNRNGVRVTPGNRDGTVIQGNFIGTDITGTVAIPNHWNGIHIESSNIVVGGTTGVTPGGPCTGACNLIAGNDDAGIKIEDTSSVLAADSNIILGNFIGTDVNGSSAIPNGDYGITLEGANNTQVGGTNTGERNLISGNTNSGLRVLNSDENIIRGNYIGTNVTGMTALSNGHEGARFESTSDNTFTSNVVSGNTEAGVLVLNSTDTEITGTIGVSPDGTTALPNQIGIQVVGSQDTEIRSVILSGNAGSGLLIDNSQGTTLSNSMVGLAGDTVSPLPNGGHGIEIINNASDNSISDDIEGGLVYNFIGHNGGDGIYIASGVRNRIGSNQIFDNGGLGIDLGPDGVNTNDVGDGDTGANNLQNVPELTEAALQGSLLITGSFNSTPSTTYQLFIYRSTACDPSGYGEGELFVSEHTVVTDSTGFAAISIETPFGLILDEFITVRATDPLGNSSEFSNCLPITRRVRPPLNFAAQVINAEDIQIDWEDDSVDETHFLLERSVSGQNNWSEIASIPTNNEGGKGETYTYHDTDFLCGTALDYRLRAWNEPGDYYSIYTPVATVNPACPALVAPPDFTATAIAYNQVELTWTDILTETSYVIEHSLTGGAPWTTLITVPANTTSAMHNNLQCTSNHSYRARAIRAHDSAASPYTAVQSVTMPDCPPSGAPTNVNVTPVSNNALSVDWQAAAPGQVSTFHVERSSNGTNWSEIRVVPGQVNSIMDSNLTCNTTYSYRVRSYRQSDDTFSAYSTPANGLTMACPAPVTKTVGLTQNGQWYFWETNAPNSPIVGFDFGPSATGWVPISGDWDGDGTDGIGLYQNGTWILRQVTDGGPIDQTMNFGPAQSGWQPIAGDWDGDGTDGIGLYKDGQFMLRQTATSGPADMIFGFGPVQSGWQPVAGDWNASGNDTVGLYKDGMWLLSNSLPAIADLAPINFGQPGWLPVTGDWNEDGITSIGIFNNGDWNLRNSNSTGGPDISYHIGNGSAGWKPIANYRGDVGDMAGDINLPPVADIQITNPECNDPDNCTVIMAPEGVATFPVLFDGSGSYDVNPGGEIVRWTWTLDLPGGDTLVLADGGDGSDSNPRADIPSPDDFPELSLTVGLEYRVTLRVEDDGGEFGIASVTFLIDGPPITADIDLPPVAIINILNSQCNDPDHCTTLLVPYGTTTLPIFLDGADSYDPDAEGYIVNWEWVLLLPNGDIQVLASGGDGIDGNLRADTPLPTQWPDLNMAVGTEHVVGLRVTDNTGSEGEAMVTFSIVAPQPTSTPINIPPIANIEILNSECNDSNNCTVITAPVGNATFPVFLDGSGSYDPNPDGEVVFWEWTLDLPDGAVLVLASGGNGSDSTPRADIPSPTDFPWLNMDVGTQHRVTLRIIDDRGGEGEATVVFSIFAEEASGASLDVSTPTPAPTATPMPTDTPTPAAIPPTATPQPAAESTEEL